MATAVEKWLQDNTFQCARLGARITREACAISRANNQAEKIVAGATRMIKPGCCTGCAQANGEITEQSSAEKRAVRKQRWTNGGSGRKPKVKKMAAKGICKGCGREKSLPKAGLCGRCIYRQKMGQDLLAPGQRGEVKAKEIKEIKETKEKKVRPAAQAEKPEDFFVDFFFDREDEALFQALATDAKRCRRTVKAQLLTILDAHYQGVKP